MRAHHVNTDTARTVPSTQETLPQWDPYQVLSVATHQYAGFPRASSSKEPTCQCRSHRRRRFHPWVGKGPWGRRWQPAPVLLPGESHGQRSLEGCSPWGRKESVVTEVTWQAHVRALAYFRYPQDNSAWGEFPISTSVSGQVSISDTTKINIIRF